MKKFIIIALMLLPYISLLHAQDQRALRAARMSFSAAESNYSKGRFAEAAPDYEIVINSIPVNTPVRKNLEMRLESISKLIDIYYNRVINLESACGNLNIFFDDMADVRFSGILKASELLTYQRREKQYEAIYLPKCSAYYNLDNDMEEFRKKFEKEFENKEE
jgi:hypothetical protein